MVLTLKGFFGRFPCLDQLPQSYSWHDSPNLPSDRPKRRSGHAITPQSSISSDYRNLIPLPLSSSDSCSWSRIRTSDSLLEEAMMNPNTDKRTPKAHPVSKEDTNGTDPKQGTSVRGYESRGPNPNAWACVWFRDAVLSLLQARRDSAFG